MREWSSRRIEKRLVEDVPFRVVGANQQPAVQIAEEILAEAAAADAAEDA